jgi:hypothetical protein
MRMKKLLSIILTFIGIVSLFPIIALAVDYFSQSDIIASIVGVGDGMSSVTTFVDLDADGVRDPSEPPLPGVCIIDGYRPDPPVFISDPDPCHFEGYTVTDEEGWWGDEFIPGGGCEMQYVFAVPPEGYHSTNTPAGNPCFIEFGFVQEDVQPLNDFLTMDEYARKVRTISLVKQLAIAAVILTTASIGTWWLNRPSPE